MAAFQQRKKLRSDAGRIAGSLIAFLFTLRRLNLGKTVFWREVIGVILPNTGKEVIKSAYPRGIAERKTTEEGVKRSFSEHTAPESDGSYLQFQSKQKGTQHTGREPWNRPKNRIAFLHYRIGLRKIKKPKLYDIIPSAFSKYKGIRIEIKEIGYKSILIGGMSARIQR